MDPCESTEFDHARQYLFGLKKERANDRSDWFRVGAALKSVSDTLAMFDLFVLWSRCSPKFDSVDDCRETWNQFERGSLNTLIRMAEEDGFYLPGQKAIVTVDADEKRTADEIVEALHRDPNLYARGNQIVRVNTSTPPPPKIARDPEAPRIEAVSPAAMREIIATVVDLKRYDLKRKQLVPTHVPMWSVNSILARNNVGLPTIEMVTEVPMLRDDGSVADKPGFDRDSGVHYAPTCFFPPLPSVEEARDALLDPVQDFPWPDEAHKAAWLASTLTLLARLAFNGPAPLNLADANTPGAGKTMTQSLAAIIGTGRPLAAMSCPESDAEMRKRLTAIAVAGEPSVLIDNIASELAFPSLDAALTSSTWSDRLLGINKTITVPLRTTFFGNGNNLTLHRDTMRRVNYYRLESRVERPEQRGEFKYPNLLAYVQQHRGYLTSCALAILAGYCRKGRPDQYLAPLGSYEGWSDLVRSAITWIELPDPMLTRASLAESSDTEGDTLRQLLAGWKEIDTSGHGVTAAEALDAVDRFPDKFDTLRAALAEFNRNKQALGIRLAKFRGRVCGGECFEKSERNKVSVWKVKAA